MINELVSFKNFVFSGNSGLSTTEIAVLFFIFSILYSVISLVFSLVFCICLLLGGIMMFRRRGDR